MATLEAPTMTEVFCGTWHSDKHKAGSAPWVPRAVFSAAQIRSYASVHSHVQWTASTL